MSSPSSKARRAAQAAKVTARSAQSSGMIKCYVECYERPDGMRDLRLREKLTRRTVRVLTDEPMLQQFAPLSNLLQDCYAHGGGLIEARNRNEHVAILAPIFTQNAQEIAVWFGDKFSVTVNILSAHIISPPLSVWCYIEEYPGENGHLGLRLRQKVTGRKVEIYGKTKDHLTKFLASPRFTGAYKRMPNLYEKDGYHDYVLVSGGTAVDSYDVLLFKDGAQLTYLLGPTPDTAYRDAFRILEEESAAAAHSRTAVTHFNGGRYREAVLSARLAVEMACGGRGVDVKRRLAGAPQDVSTAGDDLFAKRNIAVHEGGTRVEQQDARESIRAMTRLLGYLELKSGQP
ncbi:hypothetical protein NFJ07_24325 [Arthrobacter sp. B2a2-09]|uniref:hypothetical protein n=1 Tax=Arthrobacter sp. B2a2-09 TaxID=2952822 RepID=UPI0022CD30B3|nr:hypothetical protein [Arthrobacter sp. B2a2-09]MCZ9884917.1 hypothetical protein [Arthrobacter sp. B2a2-09]